MRYFELRDFRMVKTITEAGNLTRAAKRLHVSQPALSRQLLDLEDRIGSLVFKRSSRKMILTPIGHEILESAIEVLGAVEKTEKSILNKTKHHKGELKIGLQCIFSFQWLPEVVSDFQARFPLVDLEINSVNQKIADLENNRCDFIVTGAIDYNEQIYYDPLFEDEIAVIMSPDHALAGKRVIATNDFASVCLLSHTEKAKDMFYQICLKSSNIEPVRFMCINQTQALIQMIRAGMGIALLPKWTVTNLLESDQLKCSYLEGDSLKWKWYAARLKGTPPSHYQEEFIQTIRDRVTLLGSSITELSA